MTDEANREFSSVRGQFWLWLGFLLPPIFWAIQLQTVYLTSEAGCLSGDFMANHLVSIFAILFSIVGGAISWRNWLETGKGWKSEQANSADRSRFIAILGMLNAGLFALLIFAQWLPTLLGVPCDK
jgi:hypothetical protein